MDYYRKMSSLGGQLVSISTGSESIVWMFWGENLLIEIWLVNYKPLEFWFYGLQRFVTADHEMGGCYMGLAWQWPTIETNESGRDISGARGQRVGQDENGPLVSCGPPVPAQHGMENPFLIISHYNVIFLFVCFVFSFFLRQGSTIHCRLALKIMILLPQPLGL